MEYICILDGIHSLSLEQMTGGGGVIIVLGATLGNVKIASLKSFIFMFFLSFHEGKNSFTILSHIFLISPKCECME